MRVWGGRGTPRARRSRKRTFHWSCQACPTTQRRPSPHRLRRPRGAHLSDQRRRRRRRRWRHARGHAPPHRRRRVWVRRRRRRRRRRRGRGAVQVSRARTVDVSFILFHIEMMKDTSTVLALSVPWHPPSEPPVPTSSCATLRVVMKTKAGPLASQTSPGLGKRLRRLRALKILAVASGVAAG